MSRRRTSRVLAAAFLAALPAAFAVGASPEEGRRVLLDRELQARSIRLVSLTSDSIIYEDDQGRRRQATVGGFVGLLPKTPPYGGEGFNDAPRSAGDEAPPGAIRLVDGQRFPGERAPSGGDGDSVTWTHPSFGRLTFPLDRVAEVVLDAGVRAGLPDASPRENPVDDTLLLVNGDTLTGFITSLGDPVEIEVNGRVIELPPSRVASVDLANKAEPLAGLVVWLDDGTVAVVASIDEHPAAQGAGPRVRIQLPGGAQADFPLDAVRAVAFDAGRLRPLASIPPRSQRAIARRMLLEGVQVLGAAGDAPSAPGQMSAPDVLLPGAMSASWTLPPGASRFAAIAELPLGAQPWGDCEFVVSVDGAESFRTRLSSESPRKEFSVPLAGGASASPGAQPARELTISVEPGNYGPVNDRVVLRRPLLLIEPR